MYNLYSLIHRYNNITISEYKDTTEIMDIFDLGRDSCNEKEPPEKRKFDVINEFPTWITCTDPMTGKIYQISREKLSKMLHEHGTKQNSPPTSQTTKALIVRALILFLSLKLHFSKSYAALNAIELPKLTWKNLLNLDTSSTLSPIVINQQKEIVKN